MPQALPVSRLIDVSVTLTPQGAQAQNINTLLILGSSNVIDPTERYREYTSIEEVVSDFGSSAPEYLAAVLWFEQAPQPTSLQIGRWVVANTNGGLRGAPRTAAQQLASAWTGISTGSFTYSKNGAPTNVSGLNFSGITNMNGVAAIITAGLTGAAVTWNAVYQRFEFVSAAVGPTSTISFLTPTGSGVDISTLLGMTAASSGAYVYIGANAETALAAVTTFDASYGQKWYAVMVLGSVNADHLAIAQYIEATNTKHIYGVTTQEAGVLISATTSDIAYQLAQFNYKKTTVQYSSSNPYAVASLLARALTIDYNGNNTVITLMYKQEPGIVAESMNTSQINSLEGKNCNVFVNYDNQTAIIEPGVVSSGEFIDVVTGTDWLAITIQNAIYNLLYTSTTKIPQTDQGTAMIIATCDSICSQAVINGMLAPGVWNSTGFGPLKQGGYLAKGFMVYAPSVDSQLQSDRAARKSVPIQIAAKLAGAVHTVDVAITVNQ